MSAGITGSTRRQLEENSGSNVVAFDKATTDFKNHLKRLGFNMDQLRFADGFSTMYALLIGISEGKFQKNTGVFQNFNRYLGQQNMGVKQHAIATKLKNFCDEYREASSTQALTVNVKSRVDTTFAIIKGFVKKFQDNYRYDLVLDIRNYKLTMDINPKETQSKEIDRNNILKKLLNNNIFSPEEINVLKNPSNFGNFCSQVLQ